MSDGGKGSKARPFSVTQEEYDRRWEYIFSKDQKKKVQEDNTGVTLNEYPDILTTEDCLLVEEKK